MSQPTNTAAAITAIFALDAVADTLFTPKGRISLTTVGIVACFRHATATNTTRHDKNIDAFPGCEDRHSRLTSTFQNYCGHIKSVVRRYLSA